MEMIVFVGLQGSGKSTHYQAAYRDTHLRINLDMLRTRRRERAILAACLEVGQRLVIDNTNPTVAERADYLALADQAHFRKVGVYFDTPVEICLARNGQRAGKARVPDKGVTATAAKLVPPSLDEGFDDVIVLRPEATRQTDEV